MLTWHKRSGRMFFLNHGILSCSLCVKYESVQSRRSFAASRFSLQMTFIANSCRLFSGLWESFILVTLLWLKPQLVSVTPAWSLFLSWALLISFLNVIVTFFYYFYSPPLCCSACFNSPLLMHLSFFSFFLPAQKPFFLVCFFWTLKMFIWGALSCFVY